MLMPAKPAATAKRADPFKAYNFALEIEGIVVGGFSSVSGLGSRVDYVTIRQGGVNDTEYRLMGPVTYTDITLEAGLAAQDPLWLWYQSTLKGTIKRKNGSIYLLDNAGQQITWWNFFNAWPVEWQGVSFDASQTLVATQRFVLAHEGITRSAEALQAAAAAGMP